MPIQVSLSVTNAVTLCTEISFRGQFNLEPISIFRRASPSFYMGVPPEGLPQTLDGVSQSIFGGIINTSGHTDTAKLFIDLRRHCR